MYAVVYAIPEGRVTTYGAIARYLGAAGSARLVGTALKMHPQLRDLPAHRVLNRQGLLTGKHQFAHPGEMAALLRAEGLEVIEDQMVNFKAHFWDPAHHLPLEL